MTTPQLFCSNPECENEAAGVLAVSVKFYGDTLYNFGPPCGAAFSGGVQHGTFRAVDHMANGCNHDMATEDEKGHIVPSPEMFLESTKVHEIVAAATAERFGP